MHKFSSSRWRIREVKRFIENGLYYIDVIEAVTKDAEGMQEYQRKDLLDKVRCITGDLLAVESELASLEIYSNTVVGDWELRKPDTPRERYFVFDEDNVREVDEQEYEQHTDPNASDETAELIP